MKQTIAVTFLNVTKKYVLHHEKPTLIENIFCKAKKDDFIALNSVSLDVYKGEKIGIIGANGSGKTSLLKIISGITTPTSGSLVVSGKVVSIINLEAGFHPDLSGEENIYLNAMLLQMKKKEIDTQLKNIIAFADIGKFIDAPLYTYSSGMKLRLGFSIAVHSNPDILVVDEALAVGDQNFKIKSFNKIQEFFKKKKTIFYVSHLLPSVRSLCSKVIWLEKGRVIMFDQSDKVIDAYEKSVS